MKAIVAMLALAVVAFAMGSVDLCGDSKEGSYQWGNSEEARESRRKCNAERKKKWEKRMERCETKAVAPMMRGMFPCPEDYQK